MKISTVTEVYYWFPNFGQKLYQTIILFLSDLGLFIPVWIRIIAQSPFLQVLWISLGIKPNKMDTVEIFARFCYISYQSTIRHYIQLQKLHSWYTKTSIFKYNVKLLKKISSTVLGNSIQKIFKYSFQYRNPIQVRVAILLLKTTFLIFSELGNNRGNRLQ